MKAIWRLGTVAGVCSALALSGPLARAAEKRHVSVEELTPEEASRPAEQWTREQMLAKGWTPYDDDQGGVFLAPIGRRWAMNDGAGLGSCLTYSFMADGLALEPGPPPEGPTTWFSAMPAGSSAAVTAATATWAAAADLHFTLVTDGGGPFDAAGAPGLKGNLRVASGLIATPNVLAHAYFPPPNGVSRAGDVHYDTAWAWTLVGPALGPPFDVETVALHELGHSLGLDHSGTVPADIMFPSYTGLKRTLAPGDIAFITSIYGASGHAAQCLGACCFSASTCGDRTQADCLSQGGTFQGIGSQCPTQGVQSAMHASGPVVHWVNPAMSCFNISPLTGPPPEGRELALQWLAAAERQEGADAIATLSPILGLDLPDSPEGEEIRYQVYERLSGLYPDSPAKQVELLGEALQHTRDPERRATLEGRIAALGGDRRVPTAGSEPGYEPLLGLADTCTDANAVSLPFTAPLEIEPGGDHDWFVFNVNDPSGGAILRIETFSDDPGGTSDDTDLRLCDNNCTGAGGGFCDGAELGFADDGGGNAPLMSRLDTDCLPNGTYYLAVGGGLDTAGADGCALEIVSESGCTPGHCDVLIDAWMSSEEPTEQTCHTFGTFPESPPIPADFFGPGSEPFFGEVCLIGQPLGPTPFGDFGIADTLILRSADPFDRCDLPSPVQSTVDIQIVALNLVSTEPIQVIVSGQPTFWDVFVDLSQVPQPQGQLTGVKTQCNGGNYSSQLPVLPRFTFVKVGDPGDVHVLDTGLEALPPIQLQQNSNHVWVHDLDPYLNLEAGECSGFHPGIGDPGPFLPCDCNGNGRRDKCDVEDGSSPDCNANEIPDECDPDGDADGVPDNCDNCPDVPDASNLCVATPGETPQLLVTAYNTGTGDLDISYGAACSTADHTIVYGLLQDVATYAYSGQECFIGNTGTYAGFNPGPDSSFFLVVANDGLSTEGSYGRDSSGAERPEDTGDPVCALVQDLVGRCD